MVFVVNVNGQDYLRILGRNHYSRCADYYKFKVDFISNFAKMKKESCYIALIGNLQNVKVDTNNHQIIVSARDLNDVYLTDSLLRTLKVQSTLYYAYDQNNYEYQDNLAIDAIKDANKKAQSLAKVLGKKIDKIINVDDVVDRYLFNEELLATTPCEKNLLSMLMEYFSEPEDPGKTEFEDPCINGQYAVWVTYKLK